MSDRLNELNTRRAFCQLSIKILDKMTLDELAGLGFDEAARKKAIVTYQGQLAEIDKMITEITGTPPPVVVGLQTAHMELTSRKVE